MLYTGQGDFGTSKLFDTHGPQRLDKDSLIFESLGRVDELTSYLGLCWVKAADSRLKLSQDSFAQIVEQIQQDLFNIQAELAGADKHLSSNHLKRLEQWIAEVEAVIPPIKSFTLPGGSELSAHFDIARTLVRRAERGVVSVAREWPQRLSEDTLAYLNRLSSVFFALARLTNHQLNIQEQPPKYDR